jgi:hypothetical protein
LRECRVLSKYGGREERELGEFMRSSVWLGREGALEGWRVKPRLQQPDTSALLNLHFLATRLSLPGVFLEWANPPGLLTTFSPHFFPSPLPTFINPLLLNTDHHFHQTRHKNKRKDGLKKGYFTSFKLLYYYKTLSTNNGFVSLRTFTLRARFKDSIMCPQRSHVQITIFHFLNPKKFNIIVFFNI